MSVRAPPPHAQSCGSPRSRTPRWQRAGLLAATWMEGCSFAHVICQACSHSHKVPVRSAVSGNGVFAGIVLFVCNSLKLKRIGMQVGSLYVNWNQRLIYSLFPPSFRGEAAPGALHV